MANVACRVKFRGHVQGVSFRYYAKRFADSNDVKGWVRNMDDGTVEALFEGDESAVNRVIEECRTGNPHAGVTDIEMKEADSSGRYQSFTIR